MSNANDSATTIDRKKKIKSLVLTSTGSGSDYSNITLKDEDYPAAADGNWVIVRVKAAGLNFAELMQRQGLYKPSTKTPYTPGYEASGLVEECGTDVTDLKVNDRVIVFAPSGIWKESVRVPRDNCIRMPDTMSFEDGAGFLVNYVTAYQILFRMANLQPNDVVLIHMAAGLFVCLYIYVSAHFNIRRILFIRRSGLCCHSAVQNCAGRCRHRHGSGQQARLDQVNKTIEKIYSSIFESTKLTQIRTHKRENGVDHAIDYTTSNYVSEIKKLYPDGKKKKKSTEIRRSSFVNDLL